MASVVTEAVLDRVEKNSWKIAAQWGLGVLVSLAAAVWFAWRATSNETFVRDTLMDQSKAQQQVIAQNGEQLKQNSELLRSNQECLQNCTRAFTDVTKTLDRAIEKLQN
ncbi:MAG: hypothetical protein DWQ31_16695 [Planctomycetota bacterium]|nr:MAG: hypothetical protein DWQ31_16695 [Planctomycetota bacterium]